MMEEKKLCTFKNFHNELDRGDDKRSPVPSYECNLHINVHSNITFSYSTELRVGLSKLNFHKFKHNFGDTVNPICPLNDGIEDAEHFLLLCLSFDAQ